MKHFWDEIIGLVITVVVVVFTLWLSKVIFDAVIGSNLPDFWKYILLR